MSHFSGLLTNETQKRTARMAEGLKKHCFRTKGVSAGDRGGTGDQTKVGAWGQEWGSGLGGLVFGGWNNKIIALNNKVIQKTNYSIIFLWIPFAPNPSAPLDFPVYSLRHFPSARDAFHLAVACWSRCAPAHYR